MNTHLTISIVSLGLLGAELAPALANNLLVNPSFESPVLTPGTFTAYGNGSILGAGWIAGPGGYVDIITSSYSNFDPLFRPAADGNQYVYFGDSLAQANLYQDVSLKAGTYHLTFDLAPFAIVYNGTGSKITVDVLNNGTSASIIGGPQLFTRPNHSDFATETLDFTVSANASCRLSLTAFALYQNNIDNFSLTQTSVPDQTGTAWLFGGGLLTLLLAASRRRVLAA